MSATAALAAGLTIGVATPSDAAAKHGTSVSLTSIVHVATKQDKGSTVVAGDKADLKGKASSNLVGRRLSVQLDDGDGWSTVSGSGTVSHKHTFSIRITVQANSGKASYRVVFGGSSTLSGSTGSKSVTVWTWTPLVQLPVASTTGSTAEDAAAHAQTNLVVAGKNYSSLLAGNVPTGGTGAATFDVENHCRAFSSTIGMTDGSPSAATMAYSVYFGDVAEIAPTLKHGATKAITLAMSNVSQLVLRNTEPDPYTAFTGPTVAAWPNAQVLCDVSF